MANRATSDLKALKEELSCLRKERDELFSEIGRSEALAMSIKERENRINNLTVKLRTLQDYSALPDADDLREQSNCLEKELNKLKNERAIAQRRLEENYSKAKEALNRAGEDYQAARNKCVGLVTKAAAFKAIKDVRSKLCEKCQAVFSELADLSGDNKRAEERLIKAERKKALCKKNYEKTAIALNQHKSESIDLIRRAERKIERLAYDISAAERKRSERDASLAEIKKELKKLQKKKLKEPLSVDKAKQQLEDLIIRIKKLEGRLTAVQKKLG